MVTLKDIGYIHPDKDLLFSDINLTINKYDKAALIGNNGIGKSTLLQIMAGKLRPSVGSIVKDSLPYYVPQLYGQFNDLTIANALQVHEKLNALKEILGGSVTTENMTLLDDDWTIEERCKEALSHWELEELDLSQKVGTLSGGQKTKLFLAGISIHKPQIVLLDEPSNHLDVTGRTILYDYINTATNTLIIVSHDRTLLNLLDTICELRNDGVVVYGGNYDFYVAQKAIEINAFNDDLRNKEKALRKAKDIERESVERQQKLDARGRKKQEKAGLPTISMNTLKNNAEKSTARMKDVHTEKVHSIAQEVDKMRKGAADKDKIKIGIDNSTLHRGKILVTAKSINHKYSDKLLWEDGLSFQIISGQRIAIAGVNGSGKTTLIKLLLGELQPVLGIIQRAEVDPIYIDQDYSLIDNRLTVYEQVQQYNTDNLLEYEVKSRLTHFLFTKADWDKPCETLSGGEKMRLILCCLTIKNTAPDMIILDEPTNNLDIQNVEILTSAINDYKGTVIVVSHDNYFIGQINVTERIELG